jgi:DNA (cytosine-5)-methyltransferase 1
MSKPRLLDLFCGAGGAAVGYHRAGFEVVGVDINPQPHYPFEFHQADALDFLDEDGWGFDAIHASPPCQLFSRAGKLREAQGGKPSSLDLLTPTKSALGTVNAMSGIPFVIENVPGSPLEGITLCGSAFGLGVRRHRIFASNVALLAAGHRHKEQGRPIGVYHVLNDAIPQGGRTARTLEEAQEAMGIDWMTWPELKEAIPPAYTEWIGQQLMAAIERAA